MGTHDLRASCVRRVRGPRAALLLTLIACAPALLSACSVTVGAPAPTPGPGQPTNTPIEQVHFDVTRVPSPTLAAATMTPAPAGAPIKHTIKSGETLSDIAQQYGITVEDIVKLNNIADPNQIQAGQVVLIPAKGSAPAPTTTLGPTKTTTKVP
jgi:LysM repeat protein